MTMSKVGVDDPEASLVWTYSPHAAARLGSSSLSCVVSGIGRGGD
jgi:hypothetical protein